MREWPGRLNFEKGEPGRTAGLVCRSCCSNLTRMSEPNLAVQSAVCPVGGMFQAADRAYRRALRRHDFRDNPREVAHVVLFFSYGMGRPKAYFPLQRMLAECLGMDESEVSRELKWLRAQRVLEVDGEWYALMPPESWKVPLKVDNSDALEAWLERVDPAHPELFPKAPSLNDALREVFAEGQAAAAGTAAVRPGGSPSRDRAESTETERPSRNCSESERGGLGKSPSPSAAIVGSFPTGTPREDSGSRYREAREQPSRPDTSRERVLDLEKEGQAEARLATRGASAAARPASATESRATVEAQLYELIGEHERDGACARMWERAIEQIPDTLEGLIGEARYKQRSRQLHGSVAAYLNRTVYNELTRRAEALRAKAEG